METADKFDVLREDVATLRALIDVALDRRVDQDDPLLNSCAAILRERREQLQELQAQHHRNL